jgi:hypothetical protein
MAKDKVVFLYEKLNDEVIAVFVDTHRREIDRNINAYRTYYDGYAHIGQHTSISLEYIESDDVIEADPEQFSNLLEEIVQIGYKPEVIQIKSKLC